MTNHTSSAEDILRQLTKWGENRVSIRAMLLTSTRTNPNASVDIFSDYDVVLAVQDIHPFYDDRTWLQDFGEVLVGYWDPIYPFPGYGIDQFANVIQFADGLKIDFTLWPVELFRQIAQAPTLPADLDIGYIVLLDKDYLTGGMKAPTYTAYLPTPPTNETFQRVVEEFFSDAPYVAKCLWRDELLPAKWCLDYDMKHVYLRPMLEWRMACEHQWSLSAGALGKGLKKHLPPDLWAQLEETYTGASISDNWEALFRTLAFYRRVAMEVADHLGYAYPIELDQRVTAYVRQMRHLESL
jgi:aminoglycoside 6-adenylyltransferase